MSADPPCVPVAVVRMEDLLVWLMERTDDFRARTSSPSATGLFRRRSTWPSGSSRPATGVAAYPTRRAPVLQRLTPGDAGGRLIGVKLPTNGYKIDDYREFARRARRELRRDPRQAVEKSYLAAVHAARQILACAGEPPKIGKRYSSAAVGRAFELLGKSGLPRSEYQSITGAFARALSQHGLCFYDGICEPSLTAETVRAVERATKDIPRVCQRLLARHR